MEPKRTKMTLREICDALEIDLPKKYEYMADDEQPLAFRSGSAKPNDVYIVIRSFEDFYFKNRTSKDQYNEAIERGVKLIIMGKDVFYSCGLNEDDFPVILLEDSKKSISAFFNKFSRLNKKVVMITGSIGKTTTKDLCQAVASRNLSCFSNPNNTNTPAQVARFLFNESSNPREVYIQEAGAGYRTSVELSAEMLNPDIFILTNIYKHHLQIYGTFENLMADKLSPDLHLNKNGIVITNFDDENIRNHEFTHRVVSFGVNNEDVDYKANNIIQDVDYLKFDIFERSTGINTNVSVKILGEHNAYNILAAFALGRMLGISCQKLSEDLSNYKTVGVRQNLVNIGGTYINMDCYNVSEESIVSMLKAGEKFPLKEGGKRVALIGGENKLGKDMKQRSIAFGKSLSEIDFDKFMFCGTPDISVSARKRYGDAQDIVAGFKEASDKEYETLLSIDEIVESLKRNVKRGDLLMVKGIYLLNMPIAIDKVYGTSFSYGLSHNVEKKEIIKEGDYTAQLIPEMGEVELKAAPVKDGLLTLPDTISGYPVIRIAPKAFEDNKSIKCVDFGDNIKNVGERAFQGCRGIEELFIPSCVRVIEGSAFERCDNVKKVVLSEGVIHIGERAFADCTALKIIEIPDSVGMIEPYAFDGNSDLVVFCSPRSFAYEYAINNNIAVKIIK